MIRPFTIGSVTLPNNLILAPMAGVTDLPFRLLCKEQGAGLLCMEMISAKAILYKNRNTEELLTIDSRENPVSLQLFGSDPNIIAGIAHQIEDRPFDILDINMGCPVPKIVGNGEGSALMKNPKLVEEIRQTPEYRDAFYGFLANRAAIKKPVKTVRAISRIINRLRVVNCREVEIAMLDKATVNNWLDVYPLKPDEMPKASSGRMEEQEGVEYF